MYLRVFDILKSVVCFILLMNCRFSVGAEQSAFYYPYGMLYADLNGYDRYKYSGKEIETANGLNHYDFHTRSHDLAFGQFTCQDKKAVDYASVSPYTYCAADPVNNIDPTGMETHVFKLENERYEVRGGVLNGDLNVYEVDAEGNKLGSIGISAFPTSFYNVDLENDRSSANFGKP